MLLGLLTVVGSERAAQLHVVQAVGAEKVAQQPEVRVVGSVGEEHQRQRFRLRGWLCEEGA